MANTYILLPYSRGRTNPRADEQDGFWSDKLANHLRNTRIFGIPVGKRRFNLRDHPVPDGLDYWIRTHYAKNFNTVQAVNSVTEQLVLTGEFYLEEAPNGVAGRNPEWIYLTQ